MENKMAETYKSKEQKSINTSKLIIENLKSRKGFMEVFDLIPEDVMTELNLTIATIIKENM